MTHSKLTIGLFVGLLSALANAASAQIIPREPDTNRVRVRFGPLYLNPSVSLTNVGVDTNVFNEADIDNPERDFTLTMSPKMDMFLRFGRTWFLGNVVEDLVWYKEFTGERSANNNITVNWIAPLTRIAFSVGGNWIKTRERPGFEIDARSERTERAGVAAVELRALSKTYIGIRGEQRDIEFDRAAVFLGSSLHDELTRTVTRGALTLRYQLTPLTSIGFSAGKDQERFDFAPIRDSDSTRYDASISFDPFALINGSATFGYRDFQPLSADVPGYSGSTLNVNLSYVALGSTRVSVTGTRDVQYSFDLSQPYYLLSGITAGLGQQIFGPVDVEFRIGGQRLAYRDRIGAAVAVSDRIDHVRTYGGGLGYRFGRDFRIGFNVDQTERISDVVRRRYEGLRYGLAVSYGT